MNKILLGENTMKKKFISLFLIMVLAISNLTYAASDSINVDFSSTKIGYKGSSVFKNIVNIEGTPYIPLVSILDIFHYDVNWNAETDTILLSTREIPASSDLAADNSRLQLEIARLQSELENIKPTLDVKGTPLTTETLIPSSYHLEKNYGTYFIDKWEDQNMFFVNEQYFDKGIGINFGSRRFRYNEFELALDNRDLNYSNVSGYVAIDDRLSKNLDNDPITFSVRSYESPNIQNYRTLYTTNISRDDGLIKFDIDITGLESYIVFRFENPIGSNIDYPLIINPVVY